MKNESLYHKTVDILYDAYFNDTLEHGDYCSCAFGNIVAANCGIKLTRDGIRNMVDYGNSEWFFCLTTSGSGKVFENLKWNKEGISQITETGYTLFDCAMIEQAFEMADIGEDDDDWVFNGLVAVLNVLKQIHEVENNDTDLGRFKKHYQCKTQSLNTR